jgi:hypothetical protein
MASVGQDKNVGSVRSSQKRCRHTKAFIIRMRRNDSDPVFFIKN